MTLDELAGLARISASHLSRLERGLTVPSFSVLGGLARALEVSLEHFVTFEKEVAALSERLRGQLARAGVSGVAIDEILAVGVPTRRALSKALGE